MRSGVRENCAGIACPKSWKDVSRTWTSSISGLLLGNEKKSRDGVFKKTSRGKMKGAALKKTCLILIYIPSPKTNPNATENRPKMPQKEMNHLPTIGIFRANWLLVSGGVLITSGIGKRKLIYTADVFQIFSPCKARKDTPCRHFGGF